MSPTDPTLEFDFIDATNGANLFASVLGPKVASVERAGEVIGLYTLVDKLGDGGFGSVWRATQSEPVQREVALKIVKLGMDTLEVMSRFEQERVALSMMDHPNIAHVLDAGATPSGRPFFAMELVRGVPITTYCLEKQLPLEQRLRLFKEVCAGVQHAHQKGIIHRDLKPSNILVAEIDSVPVPKIIDFGIAKAMTGEKLIENTLRTLAEQMIGTPLYMSPEQANGEADIDTRSDVYALGVLLYELLAGQPPFDAKTLLSAGYGEMRRMIREVEPVAPSKRNDEVRSSNAEKRAGSQLRHSPFGFRPSKDLDLITLRALAKDRTRRYESATAFAEDVQRFLNHEPVTARAPSLIYLTQRWARRHRAAAFAVVALLVGASLAVWQAMRATHAQHVAERELADADAVTRLITTTLARLPAYGADPMIKRSEVMNLLFDPVRNFPGDPKRKIHLLSQMAAAVSPSNAIKLREDALKIGQQVLATDDPELWSLRFDLAASMAVLGNLREQAVPELRRCAEWYRDRWGAEDARTMHATFVFARNLNMIGGSEEAAKMLQGLVAHENRASPRLSTGERVFYRLDCARALASLGRMDEALAMGRDNLRLAQAELGLSNFEAGRAYLAHAELCQKQHLLDEAAATCRTARDTFWRVNGPIEDYSVKALNLLLTIQQQRGDTEALLATHREGVQAFDSKLGPADPDTLDRVVHYAADLFNAKRLTETDALDKEWLARLRSSDGRLPAISEKLLRNHIDVLRRLPDYPRAESATRELIALANSDRPNDVQRWGDQSNLADVLIKQGKHGDAVPLLEEVIKELEKAPAGKVRDRHLPQAKKRLAEAKK